MVCLPCLRKPEFPYANTDPQSMTRRCSRLLDSKRRYWHLAPSSPWPENTPPSSASLSITYVYLRVFTTTNNEIVVNAAKTTPNDASFYIRLSTRLDYFMLEVLR
ncbi:hypothetical protein BYT27DRAFT_7200369 [Phlegmacium glaucopus]|nr:hypothetical protein BYT27DRAFT_7200369 [Phlegmacium glaucopus]